MNAIIFETETVTPSKVVCIGRNYVEHIEELKNEVPTEPVIFSKPNSAISSDLCAGPKDLIHYEGEISFLVREGNIVGVGFGLDLTKREVQSRLKEKGLPWERAKAFDQSAVFSRFVPMNGNLFGLKMELEINDSIVQQGGVEMMIHSPQDVIKEIQSFMTLQDNDIVMTGTPKGVGGLQKGDRFTGRILQNGNLLLEANWTVSE